MEDSTSLVAKDYISRLEKLGVKSQIKENPGTDLEHLKWMLEQIVDEKSMPIDKRSRWLGFVQGVLICKGLSTVEAERNFTRPFFKKE